MDDRDGRERALREEAWLKRQVHAALFRLVGTGEPLGATAPMIKGGMAWQQVYAPPKRPGTDEAPPSWPRPARRRCRVLADAVRRVD